MKASAVWANALIAQDRQGFEIPVDFENLMFEYQVKYGKQVGMRSMAPYLPEAIIVDRSTIYGNPFPLAGRLLIHRKHAVFRYFLWLSRQIEDDGPDITRRQILALRNQRVLCHCNNFSSVRNSHQWCHGMVLLAAADYIHVRYGGTL